MNILLVEDNRDLAVNIFDYFEAHDCTVDLAENGLSGLHLTTVNTYDVLIIDCMLPGMDGVTLCRRIRESNSHVPILMLTARDSLEDKIEGLMAGADDYVVKPFALREVDARLQALIRRSNFSDNTETLVIGDLVFNTGTLKITRGDRKIELSPIPMKLLEKLMRNSPKVVSRMELERIVWANDVPDSDALRVHMHLLRNAIDQDMNRPLIKTHRSVGYQIIDE